MALFEVVRFDGLKTQNWLVYKYPSDKIVWGSRLIVQEGQLAIFVKGGVVADVFYPGSYNISSDNLPILQKFVSIPYGGKTPFSAEIYFFNTTAMLDVNWSIVDPIQLIDPKFKVKLRISAYGQMGLRVVDSVKIFTEIIGGMPQNEVIRFDKTKDYFRGILVNKVKHALAVEIINNKISALDINVEIENLSEKVRSVITPIFKEYGFDVRNFFIQAINFPDEDFNRINQMLEDNMQFEIMGDNRYSTKRSFDVYEGAANNQNGLAGMMAAGGVGLGAAMGIGNSMREVVGNPMANKTGRFCSACGAPAVEGARFCMKCGTPIAEEAAKVCECGHTLEEGSVFCSHCGKRV